MFLYWRLCGTANSGSPHYIEGDLNTALNRVEPAGGKVVVPKTLIAEGMGFFAHFDDTEGNRVGLFSMG